MSKKDDILEVEGTIVEVLPAQTFKVELENGHMVVCYTGGKMRQFRIRLVAGDRVKSVSYTHLTLPTICSV